MSKQFDRYKAMLEGDSLTEREILNLKKLLNTYGDSSRATSTTPEERAALNTLMWDRIDQTGGYELTAEQTAKGIAWLRDQWKTPRNIERKNNPFGYREQEILDTFEGFTFMGFYDDSRVSMYHNYLPVWGVHGKLADGTETSFEYYMASTGGYNGGRVKIIG